jgi:flagellum-specific peptidoglycan hydrolase FlgJ
MLPSQKIAKNRQSNMMEQLVKQSREKKLNSQLPQLTKAPEPKALPKAPESKSKDFIKKLLSLAPSKPGQKQ